MQQLAILGATGSIGTSTLDIVAMHPDKFRVYAVTADRNVDGMLAIIEKYRPAVAVMVDDAAATALTEKVTALQLPTEVLCGSQALAEVSSATQVTTVMAAIVGAAGLLPTLAAVNAGKRVLLANKEALVMSGQLFMDAVAKSNATLLPVDSEHNAIFQCLTEPAQQQLGQIKLADHGISKILLTGSGGPFRELPLAELAQQTPTAACAHPNWSMGQKVSVDSATMLNKGLEYIEAKWLFNCQPNELDVIVHPQSIIHSMVQYQDGSVLAQLGQADMKTPIAHALHYPQRDTSGVAALDFTQLHALTFARPDDARYPCLQLAIEACWQGQAATTALNAANELAVAEFLVGRIGFMDIAKVCYHVLATMKLSTASTLAEIFAVDEEARALAAQAMQVN